MQLKDIADMEEYLETRCYCPGEIYSMDGIFYQVFSPDAECKLIARGTRGYIHGAFVITQDTEKNDPQIVYIDIGPDSRVNDCIRIDATENNIEQIRMFMRGEIDKMDIDEYEPGSTAKSLNEMMSIVDAIMI